MQWQGKCNNCNAWNTLKEFKIPQKTSDRRGGYSGSQEVKAIALSEVAGELSLRISSGFSEFDQVLGGGIVAGSVLLLGGDPGIGKSTLLLQVVQHIADTQSKPVLYVSGEESPAQIKLRAERLGVSGGAVQILPATEINVITQAIRELSPALVVIDSIQTMYDPNFPSTPGSIVQVRETAIQVQHIAKELHIPIVLVGHITKEGTVAGPRTLEHLVDVVLYLEGDSGQQLRVLRAAKNRFGDIQESGIFAMENDGLIQVTNPSGFLLQERHPASGTVLTTAMEGTRPMLVEIQALTTPSVFGYPRRTSSGFDLNRLNLLLAVLQKRARVNLSSHDVFINVVGGLKIKDPAVDAAICLALTSAHTDIALSDTLCVIGEVGLSGEIRRVQFESRRKEAVKKLGYTLVQAKTIGELLKKVTK